MLGTAQAGRRSSLRLLRLLADEDLIGQAREEAVALVGTDPALASSLAWPRPCGRWPSKNAPRSWKKPEPAVTRIIAGQAGGRRLATAPGRATRPTSDRTREGLFATVTGDPRQPRRRGGRRPVRRIGRRRAGGALARRRRGPAGRVRPRAAAVIRTNIAALGLAGAVLTTGTVERVLARGPGGARPRDFVFADPPYALGDERAGARADAAGEHGWLAPGALVAVERASRSGPLTWPSGYEPVRSRKYGEATLWYGLAAGALACGDGP